MNKMKVLIPVNEFYPKNTGGTFRQVKFAKYLKDNGFETIVVAPNWNEDNTSDFDESMVNKEPCRVERVDLEEDVNSRVRNYLEFFTMNPKYYNSNLAVNTLKKCREICKNEKIDVIFASSLPPYIHWIAKQLSKEFEIPWVGDFRDVFDQENIDQSSIIKRIKEKALRFRLKYQDINFAKSASIITTVSNGLADRLRTRFTQEVQVIMNGIDFEDFKDISIKKNSDDYLTILYTGSFFGTRNPSLLFKTINFLEEKKYSPEDVQIHFYGKCTNQLDDYLGELNTKSFVKNKGTKSHKEVLRIIFNADVLYLITATTTGIVTGKIFEYLASGRPILSIPGDGDIVDEILKSTNAGFSSNDIELIASQIILWIEEKQRHGKIESTTNMSELHKYTRQKQAADLSTILKRAIELKEMRIKEIQ